MSLGLSHSLSRYKLKFSPDKVTSALHGLTHVHHTLPAMLSVTLPSCCNTLCMPGLSCPVLWALIHSARIYSRLQPRISLELSESSCHLLIAGGHHDSTSHCFAG